MINLSILDENRVKSLFESKSCKVTRIREDSREGKKPDFQVDFKNIRFYCEVKSIFSSGDPLNNISNKIHEALKQFPTDKFKLPNVLVLCNHHDDDWINSLDLKAVLTGNFYLENGEREKIYGRYSDGRIKEEKFKISLYIWLTRDDRVVYGYTDKEGNKIMDCLSGMNF